MERGSKVGLEDTYNELIENNVSENEALILIRLIKCVSEKRLEMFSNRERKVIDHHRELLNSICSHIHCV